MQFSVRLQNGKGVEKDLKKAVELFYNSAIQGYANAQSNLGECYYNGEGVEQDHAEAFKWMKKAAEQGDADAQSVVGDMYSDGDGVQQDEEEAKSGSIWLQSKEMQTRRLNMV